MDRDGRGFLILIHQSKFLTLDIQPLGIFHTLQCPVFLWNSVFGSSQFDLECNHIAFGREEQNPDPESRITGETGGRFREVLRDARSA